MPSIKEPPNEGFATNGDHQDEDQEFKVAIPEVPITEKRKPYNPGNKEQLVNAGTARATIAASREYPKGTIKDDWARKHKHQTVHIMLSIPEHLLASH